MNMKTLKYLTALLALAFGLQASAQTHFTVPVPKGARTLAQSVAEDGEVAMYCKYIPPSSSASACASIAVAAGGDLTFTDGPCGAEVATSTFECPVSGALGGVIDVSNAACNTMGEVVDIVNASTNWRCQLFASLRSDSSDDTLVTISATQATGSAGLGLNVDSSVALTTTAPLNPVVGRGYNQLSLGPNSLDFLVKPWASPAKQALLTAVAETTTFGSGTSLLTVLAVDRTFGTTGSETVYTLWPSTAGGATTVEKVFGSCFTSATGCNTAWGNGGLVCPAGMQCLVRVTNSAALSANTIGINGLYWDAPAGGL